MVGSAGRSLLELKAGIAREAQRLKDEGLWTEATDETLDRRFIEAKRAALAAPAILERSVRMRRIARRLVPAGARPVLRRGARLSDELVRRLWQRGST